MTRHGEASARTRRWAPCASLALALAATAASAQPNASGCPYPWTLRCDAAESLAARVAPPPGHTREAAPAGSFAQWLRGLPLLPGRPDVLLFDGRRKANQEAHVAVVDLDVGRRDLQQCADAVMRLRAEYLFAAGRKDAVGFNFTSGDRASFARWAAGERPVVRGSRVFWRRSAAADASHASLRRYLDVVFGYAGSASLARELDPVDPDDSLRAGDVFIEPGFPGHAVIVVDTAVDDSTRTRVFLLAQSYMPAQQAHILRNPGAPALSPWYPEGFGSVLVTPEWTFARRHLRRFRD
jgi:hypothetical protein